MPTAAANDQSTTEDAIALKHALEAGVRCLQRRQQSHGGWEGDYSGPLFLLPGLVIACEVAGIELTPARRRGMQRYVRRTQNRDGGWGLHVESKSYLFGTVMNYVAGRILGVCAADPALIRARAWIHRHGGAEAIPSWGKYWLALLNVYRWEGVNPVQPELWLLPRWMPIHPSKLWCHTRAIYLPLCYLYATRVQARETSLTRQLRQELFVQPWSAIDWSSLRSKVADNDQTTPQGRLLRSLHACLSFYESYHLGSLRRRALRFVIGQVHHEDASTAYLDIGPVSKALNLLCVWHADPDSAALHRHIERIEDYLWEGPDGLRMQGYNGSQFWDTAFAIQALLETDLGSTTRSILRAAHSFVDDNQVRQDVDPDGQYFRDRTKGAWPFSTAEQGWPVSDCTAEGIKVSLLLASQVDEPIGEQRLRHAVDRLLEAQNPDGGWSEYERRRGPLWLERLNPAEVFGRIMVAYSYVECTSACIQGLVAFASRFSAYRKTEILGAIARAAEFLKQQQRDDGSWYGGWGVCFTYGTWFGVEGLLAAGESRASSRLRAAADFLLSKQRSDGGWAESHLSCVKGRWVERANSQVVQTSWAMLALMASGSRDRRALARGASCLLGRQQRDGDWPAEGTHGVFNQTCMINYDNYRTIMPLWALGRYRGYIGMRE